MASRDLKREGCVLGGEPFKRAKIDGDEKVSPFAAAMTSAKKQLAASQAASKSRENLREECLSMKSKFHETKKTGTSEEESEGQKKEGFAKKEGVKRVEAVKEGEQSKDSSGVATPSLFEEGRSLSHQIAQLRQIRSSSSSSSSSSPSPSSSSTQSSKKSSTSSAKPSPFSSPFSSAILSSAKEKEEKVFKTPTPPSPNPKKKARVEEGKEILFRGTDSEERTKYTANANEVVSIQFLGRRGEKVVKECHPGFTNQIFNEDETIYGFEGIKITIKFVCDMLWSHIEISWDDKLASASLKKLREGLEQHYPEPSDLSNTTADFEQKILSSAREKWKPPGEKIHVYDADLSCLSIEDADLPSLSSEGKKEEKKPMKVEVWKSSFADPQCVRIFNRIQLLSILFIDGASVIDFDDESWIIYFLFGVNPEDGLYRLMGFCTAFPFWNLNDLIRPRISQFLILPPFQGQAHGARLLKCIYGDIMASYPIRDIAVEDPAPSFESLRDRVDVERILNAGFFPTRPVETLTANVIQQINSKLKIPETEIKRCHEILRLSEIGPFADEQTLKSWRLSVKKRLYQLNREFLSVQEPEKRKELLQELYKELLEQYRRVEQSLRKAGYLPRKEGDKSEEETAKGEEERKENQDPKQTRITQENGEKTQNRLAKKKRDLTEILSAQKKPLLSLKSGGGTSSFVEKEKKIDF